MVRLQETPRVRGERALLSNALLPCFVLVAFTSGCAVDARTLTGPASAAGSGGSGGAGSSLGSGQAKPPDPVELPDCSYSGSVEPGCETIVANAGFSDGIQNWQAEPLAIAVSWETGDADGNDKSGSIGVVNSMHGIANGYAPGGGRQCLPSAPGAIYDMAGDVYVPEGQGDGVKGGPYVGQAGLSILFWPNATCSDVAPTLANFQSNFVQDVGTWTHVEGTALAPDETVAMSVRVLTVKAFKQYNFKALFDNVLVQPR